jgi:hypothetical protein
MATTQSSRNSVRPVALALPLVVGGAVALGLGVYGRNHDATGRGLTTLFFSDGIHLKVWFATVAVVLAVFQLLSALRMYGKIHIPRTEPSWLGQAHRLSGTLAFLFSLPVAYHCLWGLGFATTGGARRMLHSLFGCLFYGAFAAKVIVVRSRRMPGWALPVIGGVTFTLLVLVWLTSAAWYFNQHGFGF